ncbi:MAG: tRNA uracil 4-sulfurtransferase ThiI [Candidatus Pacearchaeota archaeon]
MQILLHVSGEIGTKGKNRIAFERKLAENIKAKISNVRIKRAFGSFLLEIKEKDEEIIKKIPGIAWIAKCEESEKSLEGLKKKVFEIAKEKKFIEFDIEVRRAWKDFKYTSQEIRDTLIKELKKEFVFKPKSNNKIFIEINKDWFVIFTEKRKGIGGLPTSTSGKVVALLSGGFDSAIASFLAMKKGLEIIFVHFHNYPSNKYKIIDEKILSLIKKLNCFQIKSKIYIISFGDVQKEIIKKVDARFRMICYRAIMFALAQEIAKQEGARALLTGDSLGQVASQTLENLSVVMKSIDMPVLMPLISYDKREIINIAKEISIYDLCIIKYADCCSFMVAKHPATKISEEKFAEIMKKISLKKIIKKTLENSRIEIISK